MAATASAAATFAGYTAASAVASMASQGVAMAMGMQDQFSWSQVGLSALGAGVSAGVGAGMLGDSLKNAPIALRAAAGNALTQGVAVATGLQKRFSWTAVAASGAAAGASGWMAEGLGWSSENPVASVGYGTLRGLVSGGIQKRDQQRQDSQQALAQVWGRDGNVLVLSPASVKEQARFSGREEMDVPQRATAGKAGGAEDFNWENTIALEPVTVTAPRPGAWQRMLNAVNRGLEWAKSGVEWMLGVQEVGVTMATGLVAAPASGYGMMFTGGDVEAGRNIAAALTYQPRLGTSQTMLEGLNNTVGAGFRWLEQQAGDGGYWLGSLTGNSQWAVWGGTVGTTFPAAASMLLGPGSSAVRGAFGSVGRLGWSAGTSEVMGGGANSGFAQHVFRDAVDIAEARRLALDPAKSGKGKLSIALAEGSAAAELQSLLGGRLECVTIQNTGATAKNADFVFTSGPRNGSAVDFLFTTANGTQKQIDGLNKYFEPYFNSQTRAIQTHLEKASIVPLDMRYLNSRNQQLLLDHVNGLPPHQQNQIFLMW